MIISERQARGRGRLSSMLITITSFSIAIFVADLWTGQTTFLCCGDGVFISEKTQIRVLNVHSALEAEATINCSLIDEQLLEVDCRQTEAELYNLQYGLIAIPWSYENLRLDAVTGCPRSRSLRHDF